MGGFVSSTGYPVATKKQLDDPDLGPGFLESIQKIRAEEIADKSKGDALSKGVALAQGLWFTTQCLARLHQRLAITELEVATLAFAVVNILIWLLWWGKPLDVQEPMVVGPPKPPEAQPIVPHQRPRLARFLYAINGGLVEEDDKYNPHLSTSVPLFWTPPLPYDYHYWTVGITALAGSMFGAIHCAAWNTDFPTATEMWIWRSGSLVIAAIPVVFFLPVFLCVIIDTTFKKTILEKKILEKKIDAIMAYVFIGILPIYLLARLILSALPLVALRSLVPSAFVDVNWSIYIPHI
ncbi:hypothetical protein MVEN_00007100 [Mycena venus]|uniref:Uncharacterized protein n=1 Tax=Mycena venus TaxID=2733690 RepID=A0A8H6Z2Q3_9AGAR|nr:hypothetical protein MVEN_00007100 [Mycena venus]